MMRFKGGRNGIYTYKNYMVVLVKHFDRPRRVYWVWQGMRQLNDEDLMSMRDCARLIREDMRHADRT